MSNQIKVDTNKVNEYINRLSQVRKKANAVSSDISSHVFWNGYANISNMLKNQGEPADFTWRITKNITYLQEVVSRADGVENFLSQIDPLNYAESVAQLEKKSFSFEGVLGFVSNFGILGKVVKTVKSACILIQDPNWENAAKLLSSVIGFGGFAASVYKAVCKGGEDFSLVNKLFGFTSSTDLGKAVKAGATAQSVWGAGLSTGWTKLKNSIGSYFKVPKDTLGKLSFAAKWATTIINAGTTLYDNYKEYRIKRKYV